MDSQFLPEEMAERIYSLVESGLSSLYRLRGTGCAESGNRSGYSPIVLPTRFTIESFNSGFMHPNVGNSASKRL